MRFSKKFIPFILIIAILCGIFLYPIQQSQAAGSLIGGGICTVGALIGFLFGGFDIYNCIWHWIVLPLIRKIANALENRLLNAIGDIITDKAGGGRDPYWITNWRNHILDSEARGVDVFRAVLADTELCPHFGNNLRQTFGAENFGGLIDGSENLTFAPGTDPFQVSSRCTLDFDVNAFRNDFTQGGWEAWNQLIQPQNNYFGAFAAALGEKNNQVGIESQASQDQSTAQAGWKGGKLDGFLGGTRASGCAKKGVAERCTFLGKTVTPGTIFNQSAEQMVARQKPNQILHAQTLEDVILILEDAVISKISGQLNNLLNGERYEERDYQANLDAARKAGGGGTPAQEQKRLTCENTCRTKSYPQCSPAPAPTFGYQDASFRCFATQIACSTGGVGSCAACTNACIDGSNCTGVQVPTPTPDPATETRCVNNAIAQCLLTCL